MSLDLGTLNQLPKSESEVIGFQDAQTSFQRNTNWWAVFASFDLPDFNPSPTWIAKKTNISVEEVVDALDGLEVLGLFKRDGANIIPNKDRIFAAFNWDGKTRTEIIDEHTLISQQILNDLSLREKGLVDKRFFAASPEILRELHEDIQAAFAKAFEKANSNKTKNNAIYKMTFTAVDVTVPHKPMAGSN